LYRGIRDSGAAGAIVFEWIDEWFKRTWMCTPTMLPGDRGPFWYDVISPEESFGIVSYYPTPQSKTVDGKVGDWQATDFSLGTQSGPPVQPVGDGKDADRTLTGVSLATDQAFLFVNIALQAKDVPDADKTLWLLAISTVEGDTGERNLPMGATATGIGFEHLLVVDKAKDGYNLLTDDAYDPSPKLNGTAKAAGTPLPNANGKFVLAQSLVMNDAHYESEGKVTPAKKAYYARGKLKVGDQTKDSTAHLFAGPGVIEVRLPWHALWVTDPSTRHVLWDDPKTADSFEAQKTAGLRAVALACVRKADGTLQVVDVLPRSAWSNGVIDGSKLPLYAWPTWDQKDLAGLGERKKPLYGTLQAVFAEK
jgi:hypothetical protein